MYNAKLGGHSGIRVFRPYLCCRLTRSREGGTFMNRFLCYSGGLLLGAAVGVGLVVLFAPQSGTDTRQMIRDRIDEILAEGRLAADTRRGELTAQLEYLKKPVSPNQATAS
jgi:hypothetical protein